MVHTHCVLCTAGQRACMSTSGHSVRCCAYDSLRTPTKLDHVTHILRCLHPFGCSFTSWQPCVHVGLSTARLRYGSLTAVQSAGTGVIHARRCSRPCPAPLLGPSQCSHACPSGRVGLPSVQGMLAHKCFHNGCRRLLLLGILRGLVQSCRRRGTSFHPASPRRLSG